MRTIFIFCVCVSILCGCSDKGRRERQRQVVADSIAKAEQWYEMQERARADSLSIIAWGDLKEINVFSFNDGKMFDFACFSIGDKYVFIKLGETCSGSEYFYEVNIGNSHNPMKKHEPTPEEKAQRQKEDEERQRIIDNSF